MGTCCSSTVPDPSPDAPPTAPPGQHHSLLVTPTKTLNNTTSYNFVYRPPHLNQRLIPGEARPRFWLSPTLTTVPTLPIVSVAWTQMTPYPPIRQQGQQQQQQQQQQQDEEEGEQHTTEDPEEQKQQISKPLGFRLRSPTRLSRWRHRARCKNQRPTCNPGSHGDYRTEPAATSLADVCLTIRPYPFFLAPFLDQLLRLRLVFSDPHLEQIVGEHGHLRHGQDQTDPMSETAHLVRCLHSLRVQFRHSASLRGLPDATVIESHGGVKRLRRVRYRTMPVTWIDLDHRKPGVKVVGEQFELTLGPPSSSLTPADFHDGNGETPRLLGTYERALDTSPQRRLVFNARLYHWFNQAHTPMPCHSDLSDICEQPSPHVFRVLT